MGTLCAGRLNWPWPQPVAACCSPRCLQVPKPVSSWRLSVATAQPIIVTKTIGAGDPLPFSRPNWNTDFFVTQPYNSYKLFFTANSSVSATYPIQGYLKFTDGSNLQVINESYAPQVGTGRQWNVQAVPGKTVSQVNFKIGASADQAATGFTYRISVQGCN